MNKKILVACGLLVAGYSMTASAVSDNTISFQGEVTDETCSLTVNGNETAPIILLPTVATKTDKSVNYSIYNHVNITFVLKLI